MLIVMEQGGTSIYSEKLRAHIQKHVPLCEEEFQHIISFFTAEKIKRKSFLQIPSQICRFENFVVEGLFQSIMTDDNGKEYTLCFPHENWWVGDFKSFKKECPSGMTIFTLEDSIILRISKQSFSKLITTSTTFERYFRILSENNGVAMQERVIESLSKNTEAKYHAFLEKYPGLSKRLSQKSIASFLGVTPEYLNQMINHK